MATTPGNATNDVTTGITGFTGTAFTATPVTAHDVLIGGATSSTIAQAAPSATSGIPLVSNGASADPSFTTAVVAGGGTGNTTFTAYSVIAAGTTATGAFQNVSGVGTSGQVLTSNGASALPTWQANPGTFAPNSTINLSDDFICSNIQTTAGLAGQLGWATGDVSGAAADWVFTNTTESGHPGIISNAVFNNAAPTVVLFSPAKVAAATTTTAFQSYILGGGTLTINWVFKIVTASNSTNRYILRMGLGDTFNANADQANGTYFEYSDNINSGNWNYKTAAASSRTTANSSTSVTTGWHNAQIVINAAASSVQFNMDGVSLGTAATLTIPTAAVTPFFGMYWVAGTVAAGSMLVDLFYLSQTLTSAR